MTIVNQDALWRWLTRTHDPDEEEVMNLRKPRLALRWVIGALSCILLAVSCYTIFSDAPADWTLLCPFILSMAASLHLLHLLDRHGPVD